MLNVAFQRAVDGAPTPTPPVTFAAFAKAVERLIAEERECDLTDKESIEYAKAGMMAIIPARVSPDKMAARLARGEKTARGSEVVDGSSVIGLDIDKAPPVAVDRALDFLQRAGVAAVVHGSPTDGLAPDVRKVRIFVELDREAAPAEIWPLRCALAEHLGLREWLDPQTSDPSRLFFAGRLKGTPPRAFAVTGSAPVPASALLAQYPNAAPPAAPPASSSTVVASPLIWSAGGEHETMMAPAIVSLLAGMYSTGGRHVKSRALGAVLAQAGWTDAGITAIVGALPSDKPDFRVEQALDAAKLARAGERVFQGSALEKAFGARIAKHVAELAKQPEIADLEAAAAFAMATATAPNPADATDWGAPVEFEDLHAELEIVPWLIEHLTIAPGPPTLLAGYGGLGKSMLAQLLVVCVATGRHAFGTMAVRPGNVLHLDYEQGRRLTKTRYQRIAAELGCEPGALRGKLKVHHAPRVNLTTAGFIEALLPRLDGVSLVVIDSLRAAAPGLDENDSRIREPLDALWRVSEKTGVVLLVIHHARKATQHSAGGNQDMRGNSAINDAAQTVIMLEQADNGFAVTPGKVRDGKKFAPFGVVVEDTVIERIKFPGLALRAVDLAAQKAASAEAEKSEDMATLLALVQSSPGGVFSGGLTELCELAPCGSRRAKRALALLKQRNLVYEQLQGGRKVVIQTPPGAP